MIINIGQNALGKYAEEINVIDIFMCWVDIQEFKIIQTENYRRSKGLHIYHKYIKEGAILDLKILTTTEKNFILKEINTSSLTTTSFDKVQHKLFLEIFHKIYIPFKNRVEYQELTDQIKKKYNNVQAKHFEYYKCLGEGGFG